MALLGGVAFGVVAGAAIYASAYPVFQSKEWASWAAAFGTFSAAGVAVYFGLSEQRKSRKHRESLTTFCLQVGRSDLFTVHLELSGALDDIDLIARNLGRLLDQKSDMKWISKLHGNIEERFDGLTFDSYHSLSQWLPSIEEKAGLSLVRINTFIANAHPRVVSYLFPLGCHSDLSTGLAARCLLSVLREMRPIADDLDAVLSGPTTTSIVPKLDRARQIVEKLSKDAA